MSYKWILIPALSDNYILLLQSKKTEEVICFDPGEYSPLAAFFSKNPKARLKTVFITHQHADHIGGLKELMQAHPQATLYTSDDSRLSDYRGNVLHDENEVAVFEDLQIRALSTPGHTVPALSYLAHNTQENIFYFAAGDTVFVSGCGRLFEGDAQTMWDSLLKLRNQIPAESLFFCGHEYSLNNMNFVSETLPSWRPSLSQKKLQKLQAMAIQGQPTFPISWSEEVETNPFLNADDLKLRAILGVDPLKPAFEVFSKLRIARNSY